MPILTSILTDFPLIYFFGYCQKNVIFVLIQNEIKNMRKKIFITLISLLLPLIGVKGQPYILNHLGVKNGLSNNYVKDIAQDKRGCIWIATESGLNRFDGRDFTIYKENNSDIINNALNVLLYDDEEDILWIGSKSGISRYHLSSNHFENFMIQDGVIIENIVDISHAADGGVWITNHHGNIVYFDKTSKRFIPFKEEHIIQKLGKSNWCTYDSNNGYLFVGHAQEGLSIIDKKNQTIKNYRKQPENPKSLPGNSVYSICIDHVGNIWVGTNEGLALFNSQTEEFLVFKHQPGKPQSLVADHIYSIKEMNDGTLWIGADIGGVSILDLRNISFMDPSAVKFYNMTADNTKYGVSSNNIRSLLQDSYGNIWIGNYGSGVDFISHSQPSFNILPYNTEKGYTIKNKPVWGICTDDENRIWLGGENEVAIFEDNKLTKIIDISPYLSRPFGQVFSIKQSSNGEFLLGIYDDGLLKYDPKNNKTERIDLGADNIDIITFYEDKEETMWIGAEYGIYLYRNNELTIEDKVTKQLRDRSVYGILKDSQGKLWIGTYGGGVSIFNEQNELITRLESEKGFCSNSISHLFMDSNGGIWIGTRNGIGYVKDTSQPDIYESYGIAQELNDGHVRAIYEDRKGNIWVSTNDGISSWNKETKTFNNYDYRDGIPVGNFIEGSACSVSNGNIYFGSLNGVCYFDPQSIMVNQQIAPVQIIEYIGFDKQTESKKEEFLIAVQDGIINLPYKQNSFRIVFSVPDYSQNQQVEYSYIMEGLENAWYNTQGENQITFRNVPYGEYKFKVKARLKNQDWDESNLATMIININPPLWLTWYAKLCYFILFIICFYLFLRSYKNKVALRSSLEYERKEFLSKQELNEERLRFYTNITHELRTPLTLILGPLEDLIHDSNLPSLYKTKINIIHGSAIRLLNLINQILEFRKTETQNRKLTVSKNNLSNLVSEVGLRYKELNQNSKVNFKINVENKNAILYYDPDIVITILNNLLSNAVKYTPEGEIQMTIRSIEEIDNIYTEIEISDTGYGIDQHALPHIFDRYYQAKGKHQASGTGIGLALVKSLVDLHEGLLEVRSIAGKGSTFSFRLLTENTYPTALHSESKTIIEEESENISIEGRTEVPLVLIIEDNDEIREYIASSLAVDYKVLTAANGREGLEIAFNQIPNIIVSDIMMPEINGMELCRMVKEDIRTSHIPLILLTAKDTIQDKEEGYESGADSYLTKPFSAKLLKSRIRNLLDIRRKMAKQIAINTKGIDSSETTKNISPEISQLDKDFLDKLTSIIEENMEQEKIDVSFIKDKMFMSHSTFYRKVKGLTGMSANEFIRKYKLKKGLQLLLSRKYNISEVAFMTGFQDVPYFRACFKDEYGMPPSEYLKKN